MSVRQEMIYCMKEIFEWLKGRGNNFETAQIPRLSQSPTAAIEASYSQTLTISERHLKPCLRLQEGHLNTHTHTHTFNGPFSGTTRISQYQKGKTNLDCTEARDSEWQWHQLGHMQVCTSIQTDNYASTPPLSFLQAGCPSCPQPTVSKH